MQSTIKNRTIFCKDNLEIMKGINTESIDLIYLDPPFNKKKVFTAPIGSSAEGASFKDIFTPEDIKEDWFLSIKEDSEDTSISKEIRKKKHSLYNLLNFAKEAEGRTSYNFCYLCYMSVRLLEMHRILKSTGSLYLHCDPTMSHYLKLAMDCVFGEGNFRNEIIWHYRTYQGRVENYYPKKHDIIFAYLKNSDKGVLLSQLEYDNNYETTVDYTRWKKYYKNDNKIYYGQHPKSDIRFTAYLNRWIAQHNREPNSGELIYECKGYVVDDVWIDIQAIDPKDTKQRRGYPTQKPLALLERIIKTSTDEGDIILDPFCGCATTCVAAEKLGRQWIGIDISIKAYELVQKRLQKEVDEMALWENNVTAKTDPPKRTDLGKDFIDTSFVYVISNPNHKGRYKVGQAKNVEKRLGSYQTGDPDRAFTIEFSIETEYYNELESYIHNHPKFNVQYEWVTGKLEDIIQEIQNFKPNPLFENTTEMVAEEKQEFSIN